MDDDGSIILGTQKAENSDFRQPQVLQQSKSIGKKNSSMNEGNDSRIAILSTSYTNIDENQVSIFDAETQKFEKGYNIASKSIHDIETQDISEYLVEANAKAGKQLPELNIQNKTVGRSVMDIHDIETQSCIDDINEMKTQKNKTNIQNITEKKFTTDIHTDNNIGKGREKNLAEVGRDVHDLETQKFDDKYVAEDTAETQLKLGGIERCEQGRDISDMETQFVDGTANEISNARAKDKDKDSIADKDKINENVTKSPRSRSSSPGSLNLSSPGVEDCPSPLNQSGHLLESSCLSEFFGEGIDKQEKMQTSNISKLLTAKVSVEKNSNENLQNIVNNEENNDEDIFEAPTQRINYKFEALMSDNSEINEQDNALIMCKVAKKKCGKSRSGQTNNGSETDAEECVAELAKKQCQSSETLSKLSNKDISNRNDPSTSVESEDMFDAPTQRLDNPTTKDTTSSSINQPQKVNEINRAVDDTESMQIINNVDQNRANMLDINDVEGTTSKDFATKNNQNDGMATMQIINAKSVDCTTNLEHKNIDYELAPTTQVSSEIEDKEKRNSTRERESSQVNLIDTLEQKLNEMFDNVNNDTSNIQESSHMSTQCLEDVLESSQSNDSTNKLTVNDKGTNSVPQKQLRNKNHSCNQLSHNLLGTKVNTVNMTNIEFMENVTPCQNVNSSRADDEKAINNNTAVEFNKKTKRISKTKKKSDAIMETLNDDNRDKTTSNWNNKRNLRNSKSMRHKNETTLETSKEGRNSAKLNVDDAEEKTICIPCPSVSGQCAQTLDSYEINDDILMRLPAVRISGTLSNPVSPSASSTSSVRSTRSKQGIALKSKGNKRTFLRKSLHDQNSVGNSEKNDEPFVNSRSNSVLDTPTTVKISGLVDTSEDSETDSETKYKRFQQIADRMLGNELNCLKRQKKGSKKNTCVLPNVSEDPKRNMDVESKSLARTSSRMTRHSSRQSDESSHDLQRETHVKSTAYRDRLTESKTKSIGAKRKISPNMVEESVEQITSKKYKATRVTEECPVSTHGRRNTMKITINRHSPNGHEYFTKTSSRGSSPMIENTKSPEDNKAVSKTALVETQETFLNRGTDGNIDSERSNIKRTKQIIYNRQVTTHVNDVTVNGNSKKNKLAETKEREMQTSQLQDKIPRVLLSPIKNSIKSSIKSLADDESQEVERILAKGMSNVQDKNLSIRESNKAKIFQRELRTRRRKRSNSDTETDSISTGLSKIGDSDNTQLDNPAPRTKHRRSTKNSISLLPEIQISKKEETFKKPTRIKNSTNFILDSSAENTIGESSQGSTDSDASTSSRVSRSKVTSIRKKEKMELNQDRYRLIDESASGLNTSGEITHLSTPSRMRRSTSILNNLTPSAMRHKVLFTGITEDYSKIIKTLGECKFK